MGSLNPTMLWQDPRPFVCLHRRPLGDDSVIRVLIEHLRLETKLYPKIELCAALQNGGLASARQLIPLLGKIGSNQHTQPSLETFKKSSYPLPLDIVARVLARMDSHVLPPLICAVRDGPRDAAVKAVDAVGFMCFYATVTPAAKLAALRALIDSFRGNPDDELLRWKLVRAFESFNHPDCLALLSEIIDDDAPPAILQEATRSMALAAQQVELVVGPNVRPVG